MDNARKISRNLVFGILSQFLTITLGVVVPRLTLTSYGSEINGLLTSVTQIYSYIALLEAGIGTATIQALYKTLGNNDRNSTNAVLSATNKYYYRTGILYLVAITLFSFIYPIIVKSNISKITIILVIIFNGLGSVINYFFQGKYLLLLQAEGKNYILTMLNMVTNVLKSVSKIVLMKLGFSVVFVQIVAMSVSLIQMIYIAYYIRKNYSWIDLSVTPNFESISQSKNVFVHQISGLIYNSTDTITLTVFCGLKVVSVYSMYSLLFQMLGTALEMVSNSVVFALGQFFHIDRQRFMKMYNTFELFYLALIFGVYSVANFFVLPFLKLYTSGVSDIDYIDRNLPILFIIICLLSKGRQAPVQAISIAGHFRETQNRAVIEAIINLVVSIISVQFIGIYGVLVGTIVALLYRSNDIIIYACRHVLKVNPLITYKRWGINFALYLFIAFINNYLLFDLSNYMKLFCVCIPYTLVIMALYFGLAAITEWETFKYGIKLIMTRLVKAT